MKKVLFFAAMLSFAVACGGENKNDNNAEEAVVETVEAVEEQAAPEVKAEAEQTVEAPEETKLVVNKVIENANCAEVQAGCDQREYAACFRAFQQANEKNAAGHQVCGGAEKPHLAHKHILYHRKHQKNGGIQHPF